jgi:hypothetical protein
MQGGGFYGSVLPEYHYQKPHYDFANKIIYSNLYKKMNPLRTYRDFQTERLAELPKFFGQYPPHSWLYGHLDYSFHKYHRHYQAHDEWYPDRKNKSLGFKQGGFMDPTLRNPKGMTLNNETAPRGCTREVRKYHQCRENNPDDECFKQKISIMEVCPDHILEAFRESKYSFPILSCLSNSISRAVFIMSSL